MHPNIENVNYNVFIAVNNYSEEIVEQIRNFNNDRKIFNDIRVKNNYLMHVIKC